MNQIPAHYIEAFVLISALALLLFEAFVPSKRKARFAVGAIGVVIFSLVLLFFAGAPCDQNDEMARFYAWDPAAKFFKGITLVAALLTLLLSLDYRKTLSKFTANPDSEDGTGEYYCLILLATAGMMWMASAKDLVSLFVSLELATITFYILVAYMRRNVGSLEAGVKFLILGALSTGFLVYGISWLYGASGSTELSVIGDKITEENSTYLLFGLALILISLAFKVGAVPLHLWIPDVYQGAPTPTTSFLSIASKASGFAITLRVLEPFLNNEITRGNTIAILAILAGATILVGNLAAIPQTNFKRLLAYSSIANAGFILLAVAAWNKGSDLTSAQIVGFYLAIYLIMTYAAFFILSTIHRNTGSEEISAFEGLGTRNPLLALVTTIVMAAMAGVPLTAGFFGKFFVFESAVQAKLWIPIAIGFIGVAAGFYYYFQIIRAMYWRQSLDESPIKVRPLSLYVIITLTALLIIFGFYPQPILWLLQAA